MEDEASFMDDGGEDTVDVGDLGEGLVEAESDGSLGDVTEGIAGEDADIDEFDDGGDDGGAEGTDDPIEDDVDDALLPGARRRRRRRCSKSPPRWWATISKAPFRRGSRRVGWCARARGRASLARPSPWAAGASWRRATSSLVVEEGAHAARRASFEGGAVAVAITEDAIVTANARGQIAPRLGRHGRYAARRLRRSIRGVAPAGGAHRAGRDAGTRLGSASGERSGLSPAHHRLPRRRATRASSPWRLPARRSSP